MDILTATSIVTIFSGLHLPCNCQMQEERVVKRGEGQESERVNWKKHTCVSTTVEPLRLRRANGAASRQLKHRNTIQPQSEVAKTSSSVYICTDVHMNRRSYGDLGGGKRVVQSAAGLFSSAD